MEMLQTKLFLLYSFILIYLLFLEYLVTWGQQQQYVFRKLRISNCVLLAKLDQTYFFHYLISIFLEIRYETYNEIQHILKKGKNLFFIVIILVQFLEGIFSCIKYNKFHQQKMIMGIEPMAQVRKTNALPPQLSDLYQQYYFFLNYFSNIRKNTSYSFIIYIQMTLFQLSPLNIHN
ncbi:hypothetical protein pb186bvf_002609 [Paramecium bursaria]